MPPDLNYALDDEPGLSRKGSGSGFAFYDTRGRRIASAAERRRLLSLAIPPAWTDVWICPDPDGHIQATGRDARGRKQYIYHPEWRRWREETKFLHILEFAAALPKLRERVDGDLRKPGLSRERVLAAAVRVLEGTLMRVGNEEYAAQNRSYGLTTLKRQHVRQTGSSLRFRFRGKHGKTFEAAIADRRVAGVLRRMEGLPGQHLFQYVSEDGEARHISSEDVNGYIRAATGGEFSAKDFRTWAATVLAALALMEVEEETGKPATRGTVKRAIERVAQRLGNTPTVCRQSYIHPEVIEGYLDGTLAKVLRRRVSDVEETDGVGLAPEEKVVLRFLKRRLQEQRQGKALFQGKAPEKVLSAAAAIGGHALIG